ncbi:glycosyltransferase family 4 protein [Candidatus Woesearchaeota archaeon]|nr:glycosyltransferase family 4 protein [Candidatus Woesearchaeota archaeon]
MKKLKIGYVLSYFHPFKDGTENNCLYLATEMVKLGHEVHVFTSDRRDGEIIKEKEGMINGIHIHRSKTWFRYKYYVEVNPGIIWSILEHKDLDILHIHSFGFMMYDLALILKKALGDKTKIINTPHGPFMSLDSYPLWQKILKETYSTIEFPINFLYDAVIQVNTEQWKWIRKSGVKRKNIHFVPDGIPEDRFRKIDNKKFIKKHNLQGKFVLCNLGRVLKYKGQDDIVRALPDIVKKYPNVVFLSMGKDHGLLAECKHLAKELKVEDHVRFLGMVSEDEKLQGLDAADIFILSSEWEAFGIVTLEAMARKKAVICTDCEGSLYLVKPENGLLYHYNDIEGLKKALFKLIEDTKLRKSMEKENYKKSIDLTNESIARNYLEPLYYKLQRK